PTLFRAVQGADDALGDGPFEAQWAADRQHGVADQQLVAVPERGRGQVLYAPDLYHTDVRPGVETDDRAHRHVSVAERHPHLAALRGRDHVGVGEDVAIGVHDHAGALRPVGQPDRHHARADLRGDARQG